MSLLATVNGRGLLSGRPAAAAANEGYTYSASDASFYRSNGSSWDTIGTTGYTPGGTDVAVADGGTGASTASGARTNLGLVLGTDVASLTSGRVPIAQLASGTPDGTKFIRDDGVLATPAGGGGGGGSCVWLGRQTASGSATLDFASFISSTYDAYEFWFAGIRPATDGAMLLMRAGTGGGPTYDLSSIYPYSNFWKQVGTTAAMATWGTTATAVSFFNDSAGGGLSNVASTTLSGTMQLFDPASASNLKLMTWETIFNYYADDTFYRVSGGGFYNSTTAMTAVRFLMSSGNIAAGTIDVFGYTHA